MGDNAGQSAAAALLGDGLRIGERAPTVPLLRSEGPLNGLKSAPFSSVHEAIFDRVDETAAVVLAGSIYAAFCITCEKAG